MENEHKFVPKNRPVRAPETIERVCQAALETANQDPLTVGISIRQNGLDKNGVHLTKSTDSIKINHPGHNICMD